MKKICFLILTALLSTVTMAQDAKSVLDKAAANIMLAANFGGRAINITQTTAAHAMSYKITSLYHLPHGHAVAVCLPEIWTYMTDHMDQCLDPRGSEYLKGVFLDISKAVGCENPKEAIGTFRQMMLEHDTAGETWQHIADLTEDFTTPADGCASYRLMNRQLYQFFEDLKEHVSLENNLIFPGFLRMESAEKDFE